LAVIERISHFSALKAASRAGLHLAILSSQFDDQFRFLLMFIHSISPSMRRIALQILPILPMFIHVHKRRVRTPVISGLGSFLVRKHRVRWMSGAPDLAGLILTIRIMRGLVNENVLSTAESAFCDVLLV